MALIHNFFLVSNNVRYQDFHSDYKKPNIIGSVDIHDDLIQYMNDTLNWIPSKNPAKSSTKSETGLNYHGITVFDQSSVEVMKSILASWQTLFSYSPEKLFLTSEIVLSSSKRVVGANERLIFSRNEVLNCLDLLICLVEKLKEGNLYLYHFGI